MPMKTCPKCKREAGPRTYTCGQCGHDFRQGTVGAVVPTVEVSHTRPVSLHTLPEGAAFIQPWMRATGIVLRGYNDCDVKVNVVRTGVEGSHEELWSGATPVILGHQVEAQHP